MSVTYGKWQPALSQVYRDVTREWWPFGFHWKRVTREWVECPAGYGVRMARVLNGEPEPAPPEVKLEDKVVSPIQAVLSRTLGIALAYRFSTESLKAELARRDKMENRPTNTTNNTCGTSTITFQYFGLEDVKDKRSGADRRKPDITKVDTMAGISRGGRKEWDGKRKSKKPVRKRRAK